jgi:hypothetical protein
LTAHITCSLQRASAALAFADALRDNGPRAGPAGPGAPYCGRSSGVEHNLAKVGVVGSNPIARSKKANKNSVSRQARFSEPFLSDPGQQGEVDGESPGQRTDRGEGACRALVTGNLRFLRLMTKRVGVALRHQRSRELVRAEQGRGSTWSGRSPASVVNQRFD